MNVLLNPDLTRNRVNRPYINMEEYDLNVQLWQPYAPASCGLYEYPQPLAKRWIDSAWQYTLNGGKPIGTVDQLGRTTYNVTPNRYRLDLVAHPNGMGIPSGLTPTGRTVV